MLIILQMVLFLNSFSNCSLLVFRNTSVFVYLYPIALLVNLLVLVLTCVFLKILYIVNYVSMNRNQFYF